jgi:uncharacterized protein
VKLRHSFQIPADREHFWAQLRDIPAVVGCFPGAQLSAAVGDTCIGKVKVKIGPTVIVYEGELEFVKRDKEGGVIAVRAAGRDKRGMGTAAATIQLTAEPASAEETTCVIDVDLDITGRPARLGPGPIQDAFSRLVSQFINNLTSLIDVADASDATDADDDAAGLSDSSSTPAREKHPAAASGLPGESQIKLPLVGGLAATIASALIFLAAVLRRRGRKARQ